MKKIVSQKDNETIPKHFDIHAGQEVNNFIQEKIEEQNFAMTSIDEEHFCFGGDFEIFLMSMIYKMQTTVLKID